MWFSCKSKTVLLCNNTEAKFTTTGMATEMGAQIKFKASFTKRKNKIYGKKKNLDSKRTVISNMTIEFSWHLLTYLLTYFLTYLLTYLLTPCSRVLLEKLTGFQLVKKFPAFYGTRRFSTAVTSARHLPLSCASSTQSIHPNLTSWRSISILSSHLRLGLPSGLFPSGFHTKTL